MPPRGPQYTRRKADRTRRLTRAKFFSEMLLRCLGAECSCCGETNLSLLTVDHVDGVTWDRYQLRYDARVDRYIEEWIAGVKLRVLCMVCNGRFGRLSQLREPGDDEDCGDTDFVTEGLEDEVLEDAPF